MAATLAGTDTHDTIKPRLSMPTIVPPDGDRLVFGGANGEGGVGAGGIAVGPADDGSARLPLAADATGVAGTLAYMAPEMLGEATLDRRTDVYLLGAILFEIIAGKPPHARTTIEATLTAIALSE